MRKVVVGKSVSGSGSPGPIEQGAGLGGLAAFGQAAMRRDEG